MIEGGWVSRTKRHDRFVSSTKNEKYTHPYAVTRILAPIVGKCNFWVVKPPLLAHLKHEYPCNRKTRGGVCCEGISVGVGKRGAIFFNLSTVRPPPVPQTTDGRASRGGQILRESQQQ